MRFREYLAYDIARNVIDFLVECADPIITEANWHGQYAMDIVNNTEFKQWLASIGVTGHIGQPMSGNVGWAFPVGSQFFVKFTPSRDKAIAASAIKRSPTENTATVYGVKETGTCKFNGDNKIRPLYAIVTGRLNTDTAKKQRIAGDAIDRYMKFNYGPINDLNAAYQEVISTHLPAKYRNDQAVLQIVNSLLKSVTNVAKQTGITIRDINRNNVAIKGSSPAYFDFGQSHIDTTHPNLKSNP